MFLSPPRIIADFATRGVQRFTELQAVGRTKLLICILVKDMGIVPNSIVMKERVMNLRIDGLGF